MINRRNFLKDSIIISSGLSLIPFPTYSKNQGHDHFFIQVVFNGGWDTSYLFDPRPLKMTEQGLIQNYSNKKPFLWDKDQFASPFVSPLLKYKKDLLVINGVHMEPGLGHNQNVSYLFSGNAFGGDNFLPKIGIAEISSSPTMMLGKSPEQSRNSQEILELDPMLYNTLTKISSSNSSTNRTLQEIAKRYQLNSMGSGSFSHGSKLLNHSISDYHKVKRKISGLKQVLTNDHLAIQYMSILDQVFKLKISKSAIINLNYKLDSHSEVLAKNQPENHKKIIEDIELILKFLKETPFDENRTLFDVTTICFSSEFSRTMKQENKPVENTGTDHNGLNNTVIICGKNIKGNRVIGKSDYQSHDEILSAAHLQMDPKKLRAMGRPFDFQLGQTREGFLPKTYVREDYLTYSSITNSILSLFEVPKEKFLYTNSRKTNIYPLINL